MIDNEIKTAIKTLKDGGVIGIPTETVYGLAADIYNKKGIENIFKTKERPFFDPLIVHISEISQLPKLTKEWTKSHEKLANFFWPSIISSNASACSNADKAACSGERRNTSRLIMIACITMTAMASLLVKLSCILFPFELKNIKPIYSLEDFGSIQ